MLSDRLTIETPEQIEVAYDVAGIGARFVAALIDHVILGFIAALIGAIIAELVGQRQLGGQLGAGLFFAALYFTLCGYYIFFETVWNGQTPGKRWLGLRVVRPGGRPIGFLGSATRNIIRLADFVPVLYGLGMVVMFWDRNGRRLGDMAAGALTVKEQRRLGLADLLPGKPTQLIGPIADRLTIPNLQVITLADYGLILDYMALRLQLRIEARRRLSQQLHAGLQQRLGYPIDGDTEAFLVRVIAEYNALHGQRARIEAGPVTKR